MFLHVCGVFNHLRWCEDPRNLPVSQVKGIGNILCGIHSSWLFHGRNNEFAVNLNPGATSHVAFSRGVPNRNIIPGPWRAWSFLHSCATISTGRDINRNGPMIPWLVRFPEWHIWRKVLSIPVSRLSHNCTSRKLRRPSYEGSCSDSSPGGRVGAGRSGCRADRLDRHGFELREDRPRSVLRSSVGLHLLLCSSVRGGLTWTWLSVGPWLSDMPVLFWVC